MPPLMDNFRSVLSKREPDEFEKELEEYEKQTGESGSKTNKCDVCGKALHVEIIGGNVGGKCRICQRLCCSAHFKDGLCPFCSEKMGITKPGQTTKSGIF